MRVYLPDLVFGLSTAGVRAVSAEARRAHPPSEGDVPTFTSNKTATNLLSALIHADSRRFGRDSSTRFPLPPRPNLEQYKKFAKTSNGPEVQNDSRAIRDWSL